MSNEVCCLTNVLRMVNSLRAIAIIIVFALYIRLSFYRVRLIRRYALMTLKLLELLSLIPDPRRAQGKKWQLGPVMLALDSQTKCTTIYRWGDGENIQSARFRRAHRVELPA